MSRQPEKYVTVQNRRVRHFDFDADSDSVGESGYTFNNTNGHATRGIPQTGRRELRVRGRHPPRLLVGEWKVEWDFFFFKDKSGSVNCAGSSFSIRVFGIWIGITDYVC